WDLVYKNMGQAIDSLPAATQGGLLRLLARPDGLAETGHAIRALQVGEKTIARGRKRAVRPVSAGPSSTRKLLHTFADYSCLVAKDLPIPSENIAPAIQQGGSAERIF